MGTASMSDMREREDDAYVASTVYRKMVAS
jgi:hypothetical protein